MARYRQGKGKEDLAALTEKFPKSKLTGHLLATGGGGLQRQAVQAGAGLLPQARRRIPRPSRCAGILLHGGCYFNLEDYANAAPRIKLHAQFPAGRQQNPGALPSRRELFPTNNFNEAVIAFNTVLETSPKSPLARDAMLNIPLCYKKMGQAQQALESHQNPDRLSVGRREKQNPHADGELNEDAKDYPAALQNYQAIPSNAPESFESLLSQGRVYKLIKSPARNLPSTRSCGRKSRRTTKRG